MDARLEVRRTVNAGNGVFAVSSIPANTLILSTAPPSFHVIYRVYRKEACGFCFRYNLGRNWRVKVPETGFAFCRDECRCAWEEEVGVVGKAAFVAIEKLITSRRSTKIMAAREAECAEDEEEPLTLEEVRQAWEIAEPLAQQIQKTRIANSKALLKLLNSVPVDGNTLAFVLSGIVSLHKTRTLAHKFGNGEELYVEKNNIASSALSMLCEAQVPYALKSHLKAHVHAYLHLLAILPSTLLDYVTPHNLQFIAGVAYDNAFGIRSVDHKTAPDFSADHSTCEDPGSELLGWALFPEASLFNHSCAPTIKKFRDGRTWRFWTNRSISAGEEVCITYLGGDERDMGLDSRRQRLSLGWEFECGCQRCTQESSDRSVNM